MTNKRIVPLTFIIGIIFISNFSFVLSQSQEIDLGTVATEGFEVEKLISLINGILALSLFVVTLIAYRRTGKTRLLLVSFAFALFALRSLLVAYELIGQEIPFVDPITVVLDFVTMLCFFFGVLKK